MPIVASDLLWKLSVKTGSAGNSTAGTPAGSLGKYISTTAWDQNTLANNLFDVVTGEENLAAESEYRCVFIHNAHATLTLQTPVVYIDSQVSGGADVTIGVDPAAATAIGSASAQAASVTDENTAPAGVTFSGAAVSRATGLPLSDLAPGYCRAVWVKRTTTNSAALDNDGFTLAVSGDTAA